MLAQLKVGRLKKVVLANEASNTLEQIYGRGGQTSASSKSHSESHSKRHRNKSILGSLQHLNIATIHRNTKPDLKDIELKYFHRPRFFPVSSHSTPVTDTVSKRIEFSIIVKADKSSTEKSAAAVDRQSVMLTDSQFVVLEYIEEVPPIIQNIGMSSAILNYYRRMKDIGDDMEDQQGEAQENESRSDNKRLYGNGDNGAMKIQPVNKLQLASVMEKCRFPRHVAQLLKQQDNKGRQ